MIKKRSTNAFVLLSGGIDSAACLAFYIKQSYHVEALHFSYGQASQKRELKSAQAISKHFKIKLHHFLVSGAKEKRSGHILGRNAFLLFSALLEFPWQNGLIGIGIHTGTPYYDCGKGFTDQLQSLFDAYSDGRIKISAPFLDWKKPQIWEFCVTMKIPISLTYSCESGNKPCGECPSCKDLEVLHGK